VLSRDDFDPRYQQVLTALGQPEEKVPFRKQRLLPQMLSGLASFAVYHTAMDKRLIAIQGWLPWKQRDDSLERFAVSRALNCVGRR